MDFEKSQRVPVQFFSALRLFKKNSSAVEEHTLTLLLYFEVLLLFLSLTYGTDLGRSRLFLLGFSKNEMDILELDTHEIFSSDVLFSSDYSVTSFFKQLIFEKVRLFLNVHEKYPSVTTPLALCHNLVCKMTSFKPGCFLQYQEWTKSMLITVVDLEYIEIMHSIVEQILDIPRTTIREILT